MPIRSLCDQCRTLLSSTPPLAAHASLQPMLELNGQQLYRCRCCGAFATASGKGVAGWSFNIHGQPVPAGSED